MPTNLCAGDKEEENKNEKRDTFFLVPPLTAIMAVFHLKTKELLVCEIFEMTDI